MEEIKAEEIKEINLAPDTEAEDVKQCIVMICNTIRGSVPFMRGFGISGEFIHRITVGNENGIAEDVAEQIDRFEERVEALDLEFEEETGSRYLKYTIPYNLVSGVDEDE